MSLHLLQFSESAAKAERQILAHSKTGDDIGFSRSVAVLTDGGEGHANNAVFMEKLSEEIDVERLHVLVEDYQPVSVMADLAYRSWHGSSL